MTKPHRTFFAELKRRGVLQVAAVYGAIAFAVLQGADIVLPSLGLPEQAITVIVVVALLGFPVAIALAWAYELTGDGVKAEEPAASGELEAIASEPRNVRWLAGLLALVFVALMVGSGWFILSREGAAPERGATAGVARVVVLPFTVRGSGEHDYLGEGMVDVLSKKLDVAGELRGVDPRAVLALVRRGDGGESDPEQGRAIAERVDADYFVLGVILEIGERLRLDASLYETEGGGESIADGTAEGSSDELFELVDDVAAQLLLSTGGGRGGPVSRIAAVTTDSLAALKDYLQGERAMRAGQYLAAAEAFERAVAVDSSFALAWYRLSVAYEWLTRDHLVRQAAERAFQLSGRLSERDRSLLQASVAARQGDFVQAEQLYRAIVRDYSDDVDSWFQLGEVLFHYGPQRGRSIVESGAAFERVLVYEPNYLNALIHMARIAAVDGNEAALDTLIDRFLALNPEADRAIEMRLLRAFTLEDPAEQERVLAEFSQASDPSILATIVFVPIMSGDFAAGVTLAEELVHTSRTREMRALGHVMRSYYLVAQGRFIDARTELDAAQRLDPYRTSEFGALLTVLPFAPETDAQPEAARADLQPLDPAAIPLSVHPSGFLRGHNEVHRHVRAYLLGLLSTRLGDYSAAERHAVELGTYENTERSPSLSQDLSLGVQAYVALRRGETDRGLALLESAPMNVYYQDAITSPFLSLSFQRYLRAMLLEDAGRLDDALRWYGSFELVSSYDVIFAAPSHLRRAEIYDGRGDFEAARRHYARFIELWSGCDPELRPLVDRAELRLQELTE